jgi:hypothetical protein
MRPFTWFQHRYWIVALVAALGLVAWDSAGRIRHATMVSGLYGEMVDPPAVDPASPTGYTLGRRALILPDAGEDGYQWIMQTQMTLAGGPWRVHHVDYDNAPEGREAHWASALRWWLGLLAWVDHTVSGQPPGLAAERAALWANPLLLGLLLLAAVPLVARRFGAPAATLLAFGMAVAFPFNLYFAADYPDHHGILEGCGLLTVLCLLAGGGGFTQTGAGNAGGLTPAERAAQAWLPTPRAARGWFVASAVAGGIGLWVSTASEVPVLVGVGLGAVWSGWLAGDAVPAGLWRREPALWRLWGIVGGGTSLAVYLLEYFPSHLGFRLEVNHPLYALAWFGGGELLCRYFRMCGPAGLKFSRREARAALAAAAAVALLPVVILLTKDRTFLVANRFVWLLGTQYVAEGQSLARFCVRNASSLLALAQCLPLLLVVPPMWLLARRSVPRLWKAQLALALAPALLFLLLTVREIRWWGLAYGLLFAALAIFFAAWERCAAARGSVRLWALGCGLLLLPGGVSLVQTAARGVELGPEDIHRLAERDVAHWLRLRVGRDPAVVASTPATTNHLIYFGSFRGLGTLYWENTEGFRRAAAIFAASSPDEANALVRRYGVTHLVLLSWDDFAEDFVRFYREVPPGQPAPQDAFILGLLHGRGVPPWLRLIPYRLPGQAVLKGQSVLVFEVTPPQSPAAAAVHLADYLLEMDRMDLAARMEPALAEHPESLSAQAMLAYLQGKAGDADRFSATVGRILASRSQATDLALEDRIRLAVVLQVAGRTELADEDIRRAVAGIDEHALRQLTPGGLLDLLALTDELGVEIPDPRLRRLAASLVPPMLRPKR